jgi:hypothetical protein
MRLCLIYSAQVKSLSNRPRNLTLVIGGIILFARKTEGTTPCLRVNVICDCDIFHCLFLFSSLNTILPCHSDDFADVGRRQKGFVKMILSSTNSASEV